MHICIIYIHIYYLYICTYLTYLHMFFLIRTSDGFNLLQLIICCLSFHPESPSNKASLLLKCQNIQLGQC